MSLIGEAAAKARMPPPPNQAKIEPQTRRMMVASLDASPEAFIGNGVTYLGNVAGTKSYSASALVPTAIRSV